MFSHPPSLLPSLPPSQDAYLSSEAFKMHLENLQELQALYCMVDSRLGKEGGREGGKVGEMRR